MNITKIRKIVPLVLALVLAILAAYTTFTSETATLEDKIKVSTDVIDKALDTADEVIPLFDEDSGPGPVGLSLDLSDVPCMVVGQITRDTKAPCVIKPKAMQLKLRHMETAMAALATSCSGCHTKTEKNYERRRV